MDRTSMLLVVAMMLFARFSVHGKVVEGRLRTHESWAFLTRFCFLSRQGHFHFNVTYPLEFAVQKLLLYYDAPNQWAAVYGSNKNCTERLRPLNVTNLQFVNLSMADPLAGCSIDAQDKPWYKCDQIRSFSSARERWWYIAVANCDSNKGLDLTYHLRMTNGPPGDFWNEHFSADELYILRTDIAALGLNVVALFIAVLEAIELRSRSLLHKTYKLFISSLIFQTLGITFLTMSYSKYATDGIGWPTLKLFGQMLEASSIVLMVLLLLLVGKGYTITRGRLRIGSSIRLTVFICTYVVCYAALFLYQQVFFDPGLVLYLYQSYPGYGLIFLRVLAWGIFAWGVFFTLKHYPEKSGFYFPFFLLYTVWFVAGPIVIIISNHVAPDWAREKIVNGVDHAVAFVGHVIFLIMTRPSAANANFPFHVRTSQIDVMENSLIGSSGANSIDRFGHHNYAPSSVPRPADGISTTPNGHVNGFLKASPSEIFTVATNGAAEFPRTNFRTTVTALPPLKPAGKNDASFPHHTTAPNSAPGGSL